MEDVCNISDFDLIKNNVKFTRRMELNKSLKDNLNIEEKETLLSCYYAITRKDIKGSKKDIVNKIYNELTSKDRLNKIFSLFNEVEYNIVSEIVKNNGDLVLNDLKARDYAYLLNLGFLYFYNFEDKLHVIIPDEIMNVIKDMDFNSYKKKSLENEKVINLFESMLNLYGAVSIALFIENCHNFLGYENISENYFECIFLPVRTNEYKFTELNDNVYVTKIDSLTEDDSNEKAIVYNTISHLEDDLYYYDYKDITYEELLKHKDIFYFKETNEVKEFKKYLKKKKMSDNDIDTLISVMFLSFRRNYSEGIDVVTDILNDFDIKINNNNYKELMTYINNINDNIPRWGYKGWTNKEIILKKYE